MTNLINLELFFEAQYSLPVCSPNLPYFLQHVEEFENSFVNLKCCVVRPANRCFAHRLLVEIIFFGVLTSFSVANRKKEKGAQNSKEKYKENF